METLFNGRVQFSEPYVSVLLQYENRRNGADMQYRFYWKVYLENSGGWYYNNILFKIFLNGSNVFEQNCKSSDTGWSFDGITPWYTVSNKTSGTTPCYFTALDTVYTSWTNYTSSTFNLYVAPAYTSITKFAISKISGYEGLTSVRVDWSTANTCDTVWYSTDNGSTWTAKLANSSSGSFNITNLKPGKSYDFKLKVRRLDSQLITESSVVTQSTYAANNITTTNIDITNGKSLSVTALNPSGASCQIRLETVIDGEIISRFTKQGLSATFTEEEINSLLQYCTNHSSFTIRVVADTLNDTEIVYSSFVSGTYTIINSEPEFSNFSFLDNNLDVVNITENNQVLVKNKSILKVIISESNKMVAKNYATANRYDITCANRSSSITYSDLEIASELGTIANVGNISCNVKAVDSRNLTKLVTKQIQVVDYFTPTMIYSIGRVNNFENNTLIKLNGSFAKVLVDDKVKNTIVSTQVRYKIADDSSEYGEWQEIKFSVNNSNGTYSCTDKTIILNNSDTYLVQISVQDKFEQYIETFKVSEGIPIMFISATKKNVGIGLQNDNEEYSLQVKGNYYFNTGNKLIDYDVVNEW